MPKYNKEQEHALNTLLNENVAISAGAGSGKTSTLTEKVSRLLLETELKPSELLILTFTNNAAHEMKTRIINKCKDKGDIGEKILASHIQTFDSFSEYLVKKYSYKLGIADSITVASETVINAKRNTLLDEILNEYYSDSVRYKLILNTLKKLSLDNDKPLKTIILDLNNKFRSFLPNDKLEYIKNAKGYFLSEEYFGVMIDKIVDFYKEDIKNVLFNAYFKEKTFDIYNNDNVSLKEKESVFSTPGYLNLFNQDYTEYHFQTPLIEDIYKYLVGLLSLNSYDFIAEIKKAFIEKVESGQFLGSLTGLKYNRKSSDKEVINLFRGLFINATSPLAVFKDIGKLKLKDNSVEYELDLKLEYTKVRSFEQDIKLIIDIEEELNSRLFDYQKSTNCYTFSTISNLALKLFDYEDVSDEIRETFKYIMIDEYQDTNDLQELFLSHLMKPRKSDGKKATLFVVGDAKQSIYGFRNSNVELFKARLVDKETQPTVIYMNKNYRSGEKLLNEINYIFLHYMNLDRGGIDYTIPGEALSYDKEVNIYSEPYQHFGIKRITSMGIVNGNALKRKYWEALAIIDDIKKKIANKFQVSDRTKEGNKLRDCRLSDFAILMTTTSGYDLYRKLFAAYDISLNIKYSSNLSEIDAIIVIDSLVNFIGSITGVVEGDIRHLFASLARSYIFEYDDDKLFNILTDEGKITPDDLSKIQEDDIYKKLADFSEKHANSKFSTIYLDLINEFGVIEKLYLIGNVSDNIAKIESLYSIILAQENASEGLKEFIELLKNISKYDLDLTSDSEIKIENAVDMMTIHASKGLERKIVYMPRSFNNKMRPIIEDVPDYTFSKDNGIILPYYNYEVILGDDGKYHGHGSNIVTIPSFLEGLKKDKSAKDERIRLLYVALTRAENIIYIVGDGDKESKERTNESLYDMLYSIPHYPTFNPKIVEKLPKYLSRENKDNFDQIVSYLKKDYLPYSRQDFKDDNAYKNYVDCYENYFKNVINQNKDKIIDELKNKLYEEYYNYSLKFIFNDLDRLAVIYGYWFEGEIFNDFDDLVNYLENTLKNIKEEFSSDEDEEEDTFNIFKPIYIDRESLEHYLMFDFANALVDGDAYFLGVKLSKKKESDLKSKKKDYSNASLEIRDELLPILAKLIDDIDYIDYVSFKSDKFEDEVSIFDIRKFAKNVKSTVPDIPLSIVNDEDIEFKERIKSRASKIVEEREDDLSSVFERGLYLHKLMELVDFSHIDLSYIENLEDRKLIEEVLEMPIFKEVKKASKVYKEYPYYDSKRATTGFIDLLYINKDNKGNDVYNIVDYKSLHIYDKGYKTQLNIYKENIQRIFNLDNSTTIRLVLLSIQDKKTYEIKEPNNERN